ncbi:hypothetical protein Vretifemale_4342 [Volvox reticuliferus]|uniref:Translation initiation factor 3 C-terminal domain-containing protein n=1 Tax=Volvox reticuliferus TaxID=1737510 RepID=A0A8J4FKC0_9CHLO|nr:hypothetical protein Vretifemale_4342 [Volvox reticuliferus]
MAIQAMLLRTVQFPSAVLYSAIWQLANFNSSTLTGANSTSSCVTSELLRIPYSLSTSQPGRPRAPQSYIRHPVHHSRIGAPTLNLSLAATAAICRVTSPGQQQCWVSGVWPGTLLSLHAAYTTWRIGFADISVNAKRGPQLNAMAHTSADSGRSTGRSSASRAGVGGPKSASRPKAEPVKEMHLKPRIAEHDLGYKLRQLEGWLADGIRAKLVVEFRSEDQSVAAAALLDSVVSRLAGKGQPLGSRQQNKDTWFVVLRPPVTKLPKPATQQQPQAQQQQQQQQQSKRDTEMQGFPSAAA